AEREKIEAEERVIEEFIKMRVEERKVETNDSNSFNFPGCKVVGREQTTQTAGKSLNLSLPKLMMISNGKRPRPATDIDNLSFNPEDQGQSSESVTTNVYRCNGSPSPDDDGSDTSLRLGNSSTRPPLVQHSCGSGDVGGSAGVDGSVGEGESNKVDGSDGIDGSNGVCGSNDGSNGVCGSNGEGGSTSVQVDVVKPVWVNDKSHEHIVSIPTSL
ncbi:hypothetical protein Tco_1460536, partial [Tanacetum coccineum]